MSIWVQPNILNVNEIDYDRWNKWDGQWTEENEMKHEQWSWWCNLPLFEFNKFTSRSKINVTFFVWLLDYKIIVQLAGIQLFNSPPNNTISLSCHEQICLIRLCFKRYFSHHWLT